MWRPGRFCLHRSGVVLLVLSAMLVGAPFLAGALIEPHWSDPVLVAMTLACTWSAVIAPLHHELAHAWVAKRLGIEVLESGYHLGGAYVVLHPPSTGVPLRAWICTLSAGPISNAVVGIVLLAGWSLIVGELFSAGGLFCMLVAAIELCTAFANSVPVPRRDGGGIAAALRMARSPVVF
jgi:Zn-dependent protease